MKAPLLFGLFLSLFVLAGCTSPEKQAEKDAYYEDGKMTEQVESWKKHGRY